MEDNNNTQREYKISKWKEKWTESYSKNKISRVREFNMHIGTMYVVIYLYL